MKIIKKNIYLIAILSCVVGLSACSRDDAPVFDGGTDNGNTIRFTTAIADFTGSDATDDSGTRATINDADGTGSFADNDETMIIGSASTATSIVTKEHPATYKDGTWTTNMTWDEFGEAELVKFSVFFPKRSLTDFDENGKMNFDPTDQSTPEKYAACDWISAAAVGIKADQPTIQLTFCHCMHRLTVNLSLSDTPGTLTQADVNAATVVIKNMETKGVVNLGGDVVPDGNNTGDFIPLKSASGNSFRIFLLPQYVTSGTPWIEITMGDKTVTYAVPAGLTELQGGKEQVVNLKLSDDSGGGSPYSTYLAGWYRNSSYDMFAYTLVNDALMELTPPGGGSDAYPKAMAISGGRTYVVGSYFATDGVARACYWVDGAVTKLGVPHADDSGSDHAESILVSDGSIYIAGYYYNNNYNAIPCYWANGTLTALTLPDGAYDGVAKSIAVSGGEIYTAGHHANRSGMSTPGYWLDDTFVPLSLPTGAVFQSGKAMCIAVSDNKVYVMGTYQLDSRYYPCVWADGTRSELAPAGVAAWGAVGQSMTVTGSKVYVSGYSIPENKNYHKGCYWVDGARTDLNAPDGTWSEAASIGVIAGKVYLGGEHYDNSGNRYPCYWLDGVHTDLAIPMGGKSGGIKAIYMSE